MQFGEQPEGRGNRREGLVVADLVRDRSEGVQTSALVSESQQRVIANREETSLQRGKDGQLVVGPLDGRQCRKQRTDLLTAVEGASSRQQMRHPARLEGLQVRAAHVFAPGLEASEENRHVARPDGDVVAA